MTNSMGIDPNKLALVTLCLENAGFKDIMTRVIDEVFVWFVFNDGKNSYELQFHRPYIDDMREPELKKLKNEIESRIIPKLKENPDKRISISDEGLQVMNRNSD